MAVPKVQGLETKTITQVAFGLERVVIKPESFKEETEGYFFEDLAGNKYSVAGSVISVTNRPVSEPQ